MTTDSPAAVGRTYTKGRRQPYLIRKWPGSNWVLPLGPYTITQLLVFVGSVYLLLTYRDLWGHFGPFNLVLGIGIPLLLTYLARHSRIEGRDPLRAGVALATLLVQPRAGYLAGGPFRAPGGTVARGGRFPVAQLPAALRPVAAPPEPPAPGLAAVPPEPPDPPEPPEPPGPPGPPAAGGADGSPEPPPDGAWLTELVARARARGPR